jgi:CpeT/CpcT family (DUF1001)
MNDLRRATGPALALLASLALLAGCGGAMAERKGELAKLGNLLPGEYDNQDQVRSPEGAQVSALRIAIVPIYAPLLGRDIFYQQEMAADDSRRVTAQRVLSLEVTPDGRLLQGVYALNEPARWRDGHEKPDLFKSLLPQDLRLVEGCDVTWRVDGRRFTGANDPARCRFTRRTNGETVHQESRVELDDDGIAFADSIIAADGTREPPAPLWYRFRRRAH